MQIETIFENETAIIIINGSLSVDHRNDFETSLNRLVEDSNNILIDLTNCTFIDSTSLGVIVLSFTRSLKNNKKFALFNVNNDIYQMFTITGLTSRIKIFNTKEEAMVFFQQD